jgi:hypothetical protein
MTWLPNWKKMEKSNFEISYVDKEGCRQITEFVEVSVEKDDQYRLLEQPLFSETLT